MGNAPSLLKESGMQRVVLSGIDFLSFSVVFPTQMLSAAVAEVYKLPVHGNAASGADIVACSIRIDHDLSNRHLLTETKLED